MAAGAYVIGFHGGGAREYMLPEFSTLMDDPDLVALASAVANAAALWDQSSEAFSEQRRAARRFVESHYGRDLFEQRVQNAFSQIMPVAGQTRSVRVRHYSSLGHQVYRRKAKTAIRRLKAAWNAPRSRQAQP